MMSKFVHEHLLDVQQKLTEQRCGLTQLPLFRVDPDFDRASGGIWGHGEAALVPDRLQRTKPARQNGGRKRKIKTGTGDCKI